MTVRKRRRRRKRRNGLDRRTAAPKAHWKKRIGAVGMVVVAGSCSTQKGGWCNCDPNAQDVVLEMGRCPRSECMVHAFLSRTSCIPADIPPTFPQTLEIFMRKSGSYQPLFFSRTLFVRSCLDFKIYCSVCVLFLLRKR